MFEAEYRFLCLFFSSSFNLITPAEKHLLTQVENYFQKPIVEFSEKYFADDEFYKI
jgi:hypothetical protein